MNERIVAYFGTEDGVTEVEFVEIGTAQVDLGEGIKAGPARVFIASAPTNGEWLGGSADVVQR